MNIIATGLSGTIGRKLDNDIESAQLVLGSGKLRDIYEPKSNSITLIHLGGIVGESSVSQDLAHSKKINVYETFNLAREVIEDFGGRFIHISSSHIYGPSNLPVNESNPHNPQSNYALQKALAEQMLVNHFGENNPQLVILRVFSVLGWDVADFTLGGAVKRILNGSQESISNADDIRDFMTPTTIAAAISKIARSASISGIFNLCSGSGISVGDASRSMFKIAEFGEGSLIKPGNSKIPFIVGDNDKLLSADLELNLNWDPINDLEGL
jgi:UDP-glucose 4-epimerase/GDP-4-dehydro-6-deoxy-D-mannose reductase